MLTFIPIEHPDQIQKIISEYPVDQHQWIVSNLKSKQDLQKLCLMKNGFYLDENILRISDFWSIWLRRLAPHFQILSSEFIRTWIQQISESDQTLDVKFHEVSTLHYYIQQLAPLLLSSNHESLMEWFVENQYNNDQHKWYKWYLKSKYVLNLIIDKNMIDATWISSYLQKLNLNKIELSKPIILDLGSEMTSVEMDIFIRLSKNCDVYIIEPNPKWKSKYQFLLNTYKTNEGFGRENKIENPTTTVSPHLNSETQNFLRVSTQLAEVKWIAEQVRRWLDNGIQPHEIALLSPQVEKYWPTLLTHLNIEGIPIDKPIVTNLISTGFFQNLISMIQSYSNTVTWENLETSYYQQLTPDQTVRDSFDYAKFKALFIELTDEDDLGRDAEIKKMFYRKINFQSILQREEFLAKIIEFVAKQNIPKPEFTEYLKFLEIVIKDFIAQTTDQKFKFSDWFDLFKSMLSRKEIKIKKSNSGGLQIRDLGAVYLNKVTHRIWFGLDDSVFQSTDKNLIPLKDIEVLKSVFDFPLQYPEESHDEFNLRWLSESKCTEQFFTCSHVSLSGEPLNTSIFILENNPEPDHLFIPHTRLDQIQKNFSVQAGTKLFHEKNPTKNTVTNFEISTVSGTDLVQYAKCEFKLLASKGFKLRDHSVVSVDLDPMEKGTLAHDLFEFLMTDEIYKQITVQKISDYLDQKRNSRRLYPNDDLFWSIQKNKFIQIGFRFSENEKKRLNGLSLQYVLEKEFNLKFDHFNIKGRIDRIDHDTSTDEYLIYDYKRSDSANISNVDKWISKKEYQMLFYILALADEIKDPEKIRGAVYYFYQKLKVNKGFLSAGNVKFDSVVEVKKNMSLDQQGIEAVLSDFKTVLIHLFSKLQLAEFTAKPDDLSECDSCNWRRLCRAAHLN
jgi:ATP-dependent helicase/nuclease subunit B